MVQQQLSSTDKLLHTCLVKLERIEVFTCGICHAVYCDEERLTRHLTTHVKFEDTLVYNTESTMRDGAISYKKQSEENTKHSETQQPYISIRDRITFESESDDTLSDTEISENSVMSFSSDSASLCTNDYVSTNEDQLKIEQNTIISNSEPRNKNLKGTRSQYCKQKKSKLTLVQSDMPRVTITGSTDNYDQQFGLKTGHEQIQTIKQYSCHVCPTIFLTKQRLHAHLKLHSLDKTFKCDVCIKKFKFKYELKVHQRVHNNERPYSCQICNTSFRHHSSFSIHKRSAHPNLNDPTNATGQPTCAICNKRFCQKSVLLKHIYKFHMTKGYPCSNCKKEFGHPVARDWHMNIHKGTFKCCVCKKCYETKDRCNRCEQSHKKPFECSNCNMKFGRKDHLTRHAKNRCKRLFPNLLLECQNCNRKFLRKGQLTRHLKLSCKPLHECARCKIRFAGTLKSHNKKCKWKSMSVTGLGKDLE